MSRLLASLKPSPRTRNLGNGERLLSGIVGVALLLASLQMRKLRGWLMALAGLGLSARAYSGRSKLYRFLGITSFFELARAFRLTSMQLTPGVPKGRGIRVERTFFVHRPVSDVFRTWRNFENLPHFMTHLERVEVITPTLSYWVAKAPAGLHVAWNAEITEERLNEVIAWQSLPGADVDNAGRVTFRQVDSSTEIRIVLDYNPPGGRSGAALAKLFQEEPGQQIDADMRRFKHMMEVAG